MPAPPAPRPGAPGTLDAVRITGLAGAAALAFVLAFPPYDLWPLIVVAPALLAVIARGARSVRVALAIVFGVHFLMWLWVERWLSDVTMLGYPTMAAYMALYAVAFVGLARVALRHPRLAAMPAAVGVPVVWVGLEALRGELVFDGFPWFLLAHPGVNAPALVQSADLFGTYFVSLLVALPAGVAVDLLARPGRARAAALVAVAVVVLSANLGYGAWRLGQTAPLRDGPTLLVVQTNIRQSNKIAWSTEDRVRDFAGFVELTREGHAAAGDVDVIAWPETMFPARGLEPGTIDVLRRWNQTADLAMMEALVTLAGALDTPMIIGSSSFDGLGVDEATRRFTWAAHYNSAYMVTGTPPYARYDKHVLTPFGEVMPYINAWPWLEQMLLGFGAQGMSFTLDASREIRLLDLEWGGGALRIGTPICFEDAVPRLCRRMVYGGPGVPRDGKQAQLLVNLSNDGWFGDGDDVRAQHVQVTRFRAIENRVPVVRCVNTGYSVSIDSCGRVVGTVGAGDYGEPRRPGWLIAETTLDARHTLYGRIGAVCPWVCLGFDAMLLGAILVGSRRPGSDGPGSLGKGKKT